MFHLWSGAPRQSRLAPPRPATWSRPL